MTGMNLVAVVTAALTAFFPVDHLVLLLVDQADQGEQEKPEWVRERKHERSVTGARSSVMQKTDRRGTPPALVQTRHRRYRSSNWTVRRNAWAHDEVNVIRKRPVSSIATGCTGFSLGMGFPTTTCAPP